MKIVYYIKLNISRFEENSDRDDYNAQQRSDLQPMYYRIDIFKQSENNMGIKLYNHLPSHLKILKNTQLFIRKIKSFLLQQIFYSVQDYLSYNFLS
jgi:hypothetical protein